MPIKFKTSIGLLVCGILCCTACARTGKSKQVLDPSMDEIPTSKSPLIEAPEEELLTRGKRLYYAGQYLVARDAFLSLRDGYPLGPYTEFSEIKIADTYFYLHDFAEAAPLYEQLLQNRSGAEAAAYLILQAARSYQLSVRGLGRDTAPMHKALDYYQQVLDQFPQSMYAEAAANYLREVKQDIAKYEEQIVEFYKRRDKEKAYQARKQRWDAQWAGVLNEKGEIPVTPRVVKLETDPSAEEPRIILAKRTVVAASPRGEPKSKVLRTTTFVGENAPPVTEAADTGSPTSNRIRQVACTSDGRKLVQIFLDRSFEDQETLKRYQKVSSENGGLELKLPTLAPAGRDLNFNCFTAKDFVVRADGTVRIPFDGEAELFALDHPPRLMVVEKQG